ncbi:MAG: OmpA family protein [Spirochaetota bacterium]
MSRKLKLILASAVVFSYSAIYPVQLRWTFDKGDRIEVVKTANISFFINKELQNKYVERNIVDLTCTGTQQDAYSVEGTFSIFTKDHDDAAFKLTRKAESEFSIENTGHFTVPGKQIMPNLRHIPHFPEKDLKKGDTWTNTGEIILDNFSIPFSLQTQVSYAVADIQKTEDSHTAKILYSFSIDNYLKQGAFPDDFPRRILGKDEGIIVWDIASQKPLEIQNAYHIVFLFPTADGSVAAYEWIMDTHTDHTLYPHIQEPVAEQNREDIRKDLENEEGISVEDDDQGIIIRLGAVLFDFDSAEIREDTEKTLQKIVTVIKKKYPDREIIVEGHTDNTGNPQYNQELSERRAKNTASRIIRDVDHDKVSYIGKGEAEPIAPNATTEGRKKNRRVDIIIKLK